MWHEIVGNVIRLRLRKEKKKESNGSVGRQTTGRMEVQGKRMWFDFMMADNKDSTEKVVFKSPPTSTKAFGHRLKKV